MPPRTTHLQCRPAKTVGNPLRGVPFVGLLYGENSHLGPNEKMTHIVGPSGHTAYLILSRIAQLSYDGLLRCSCYVVFHGAAQS